MPGDHKASVSVAGLPFEGDEQIGAFVRVVVPLAFPGIVAVIVFAFTLSAHEFIYALAFISSTAKKTISIEVPTELVRGDVFFWQSLQAAVVFVARLRLQPPPRTFHLRLQDGCRKGLNGCRYASEDARERPR